jgi:sterol desaturase/sphingolipid hydroxylase (fatty acid hydroxylase superfamily)
METWLTSSTAVFLTLAALAIAVERFWPMRRVDRLRDLGMDVLSFGLAVVFNRTLDVVLGPLFATFTPGAVQSALGDLRAQPVWLKILLAIVIADFTLYWIHRAQHTWDWAWRTHAWHHSIEELYWFSGFRTSFMHSFLYNVPQVAIPVLLLGLGTFETALCFAVSMVVQFWEHVNLRVDLGPLDRVIVTPDYHRVHHSLTGRRLQNLAPTFSLWDRLFGTWTDPRTVPLDTPLGIGEPIRTRDVPRMLTGV